MKSRYDTPLLKISAGCFSLVLELNPNILASPDLAPACLQLHLKSPACPAFRQAHQTSLFFPHALDSYPYETLCTGSYLYLKSYFLFHLFVLLLDNLYLSFKSNWNITSTGQASLTFLSLWFWVWSCGKSSWVPFLLLHCSPKTSAYIFIVWFPLLEASLWGQWTWALFSQWHSLKRVPRGHSVLICGWLILNFWLHIHVLIIYNM